MKLINRAVYFIDGKAIGAGFSPAMYSPKVKAEVIALPTEHYDFLGPIDIIGKSKAEIEAEVKTIPIN